MDSISQFVLGSACGELTLGHKLGRKAILWGGLLGTLPDLDILSGFWLDELSKTEFHRGPSHSLVFSIAMAYPIAYLMKSIHRKTDLSLNRYAFFVFITLFTHILLDLCTTWGTKVLWPFDATAYAWQIVFVLDPLYTLPFLIALIVSPFIKNNHAFRKKFWSIAIVLSTSYLILCTLSKQIINQSFEKSFQQIEEPILTWSSRPSPINNILWTAIAETESAFYIAYHSHLDASGYISPLFKFEKNKPLRVFWDGNPALERIKSMTNQQYLLEQTREGLLLKDLRFGQVEGWSDPNSEFVFRYLLDGSPKAKETHVKRLPNSIGARERALEKLWDRVKGIP